MKRAEEKGMPALCAACEGSVFCGVGSGERASCLSRPEGQYMADDGRTV